jgi:hypothetical protein
MILSGNLCYYAYGQLMNPRALNRSSKLKIYKSLIRLVVTYGCEARTIRARGEQYLRIFERRILSKIFGPVQKEDGSWRIRMNHELNELTVNADIVRFIKSGRIA